MTADHALPGLAAKYWRRQPAVFRQVVDTDAISIYTFTSWCRSPAVIRLYQRRESDKAGSAIAVQLPKPELAPEIFDGARRRGEDLTVLINGVDKVDSSFFDHIKTRLPAGPEWRSDDLVSTLSRVGSGIGFHAGHEDGYVLQLAGRRHWRVWHRDVLKIDYLNFLLGKGTDEYRVVPPRPSIGPLINVQLDPGDALYIPALFPHEGITLEESISLSVAWRGFSAYTLLRRYYGTEVLRVMNEQASQDDAYFALLSDPPPECNDIAEFLTRRAAEQVDLESIGASPAELCRRVRKRLDEVGRI